MIELSEIREQIGDAVSSLQELDERLSALARSLSFPPDVTEMWDSRRPMSYTANLYAALNAVRLDCIQDAAATLLRAVGQSDASLRREWEQGREGGV